MGYHVQIGMLAVDYELLAFILRASSQDPVLSGPVSSRVHEFSIRVVNICSSLAARNELIPVLATRPGAREEMILNVESFLQRWAEFDKELDELYGDEARFVIQSLRSGSGPGC